MSYEEQAKSSVTLGPVGDVAQTLEKAIEALNVSVNLLRDRLTVGLRPDEPTDTERLNAVAPAASPLREQLERAVDRVTQIELQISALTARVDL